MTHSAFSKQIGRLEEEVGTQLLTRLPRGIRPTEAGRLLESHAQTVEASYRSTMRLIDNTAKSQAQEITVGAGYYWQNGLLPRAIGQIASQIPQARVRLVSGVPEALMSQLVSGDVDLVFGPLSFRQGYSDVVETESLLRTDSIILVRAGHAAHDGQNRSVDDLRSLRWVLPTGTHIRKSFQQLFENHGLTPPEPTVEANDIPAALELVAHSDLATLASSVSPSGGAWEGFGQVLCADLVGKRDTGILRRRHHALPKLAETLCSHVRELSALHGQFRGD